MNGSKRVRLRPLRREDLPRRLEMINDPEIQRLTIGIVADENTRADMESWFHMLQEDPYSEQLAVETESGLYIGDVDLHSIDPVRREAWLSPMIGHKDYLGREWREAVLEAAVRHAVEGKGLQRLSIQIPNTDTTGIEILEALGFRKVDQAELDIFDGIYELTMELEAANLRLPQRGGAEG